MKRDKLKILGIDYSGFCMRGTDMGSGIPVWAKPNVTYK
jgi:hypothetical protein